MNKFKGVAGAAVAAALLSVSAASASTVTSYDMTFSWSSIPPTSYSFDSSQFGIAGTNISGATANPGRAADADPTTDIDFVLNGVIQIDFGYDIVNGPGADLLGLEAGSPHTFSIALSPDLSAPSVLGTWAGFATRSLLAGAATNGFTFDLSDLGIAEGVNVGSSIYIMNILTPERRITPDILEVVALNFTPKVAPPDDPDPDGTAVVPLPAGLPLLLGGMAVLAVMKRRRSGAA